MDGARELLPFFIGPVLLLIAAIGFAWSALLLWRQDRPYWKAMQRFSKDWLHGVVLPNGPEEATYIEHLALLPGGIVVCSIMDYPGAIFGADKMEYWTQVVKRGSFRFANPLEKLHTQVGLVKFVSQDHDVAGHVLFSDDSEFPKGVPEGVSRASELQQAFSDWGLGNISASRRAAWNRLQVFVTDRRELLKSDVFLANRRRFRIRVVLLSVCLLAALGWGIGIYASRFWAGQF